MNLLNLQKTDVDYYWKKSESKDNRIFSKENILYTYTRFDPSSIDQRPFFFCSKLFTKTFDARKDSGGESKTKENLGLRDRERHSSVSYIDGIAKLDAINCDIILTRMSGPNSKGDHEHFKKDRVKLACNFKSMLKI